MRPRYETRSAGVGQVIEQQRILNCPSMPQRYRPDHAFPARPFRRLSRGFGMRTGVLISVPAAMLAVSSNSVGLHKSHSMARDARDALQEFKYRPVRGRLGLPQEPPSAR